MTEDKISDIVEMPMNIPERIEGGGMMAVGPDGSTSPEGMAERAKRKSRTIERTDYRECISCDRCGNSLEIRGFRKDETEMVIALYCPSNEMEVSPYNTCNIARRPKKLHTKKVVYVLTNAPKGFELGLGSKELKPEAPGVSEKVEPSKRPPEDYIGGSDKYKRADGDEDSKWSGKIPKGLMN